MNAQQKRTKELPTDEERCQKIRPNGLRCARKRCLNTDHTSIYCSTHKQKTSPPQSPVESSTKKKLLLCSEIKPTNTQQPPVIILQKDSLEEEKEQIKQEVQEEMKKQQRASNKKLEKSIRQANSLEKTEKIVKHEVQIIEVEGIPYYIDNKNNVYQHDQIYEINPTIIGQFKPSISKVVLTNI
jgi:hypothetical protein